MLTENIDNDTFLWLISNKQQDAFECSGLSPFTDAAQDYGLEYLGLWTLLEAESAVAGEHRRIFGCCLFPSKQVTAGNTSVFAC